MTVTYEARGNVETADGVRRRAVMIMGRCPEEKMIGLRALPRW